MIFSYVYFVELSESLVIHDSRAEGQRLMILTCFVTMIHDSASTPDSGIRQDKMIY